MFITDGGIETDLIFHRGFDLPEFAAFPLIDEERGWDALASYYRDYAKIAKAVGAGLVLATPTWRANPDWGAKVGYDAEALDRINIKAILNMIELREELGISPATVSGMIGPRGDGYVVGESTTIDEAAEYHRHRLASFVAVGADIAEALTITTTEEAAGIVEAANAVKIPVAILFTVETNGALPDGTALGEAISKTESAGTVAHFGINCAHPSHIVQGLNGGELTKRIAEVRPNAFNKSHAVLDETEEMDEGDPIALASVVDQLREQVPNLSIVGGCCGTDARHVARMWGLEDLESFG